MRAIDRFCKYFREKEVVPAVFRLGEVVLRECFHLICRNIADDDDVTHGDDVIMLLSAY